MEIQQLLRAVVAPVVTMAVVLAVLRMFRERPGRFSAWIAHGSASAVALAAVVAAASLQQAGAIAWPKISFEWFPWMVLGVAACAVIAASLLPKIALGMVAALPLVFVSPAGLPATQRWSGAVAVGVCAWLCALAVQRHPRAIGLALWATAAAASVLAIQSSFAKLSLILGAFSACAAALVVLGLLQRPLVFGTATAAVWCVVVGVGALFGAGYDDTGIPTVAWWLVICSPAASLIALVPAIARRDRLADAMCVVAPAACAWSAPVIAVAQQHAQQQ